MSSATSSPAELHAAVLQYLTQLQSAGASPERGLLDAEPLEVAIQCLTEATGADAKAATSSFGLAEIFARGVASIRALESSPKYAQFLQLLREKDFFKGVEEGSLEYAKRMEQARSKFESKYPASDAAGAGSAPAAAAAAEPAAPVSAADKAAAEAAKNEGNVLLGKGDHAGAIAKYSEAIRLNPTNAIYLANRAAAHVNLRAYASAIDDCRASIAIDPNYAKSHYRLGQSLAAQGKPAECLPAFERALALSAKDEGMAVTIREQIRIAKQKLAPVAQNNNDSDDDAGGADPFAAMGGMGGLASMLGNMGGGGGGGEGGAGGLGGLMSMLQNPQMQEMMKNLDIGALMKDPGMASMMQGMAGGMAQAPQEPKPVNTAYKPPSAASLFDDDDEEPAKPAPKPAAAAAASKPAAGAGGANVPPQLAAFLNTPAGRSAAADPELAPVLEDIKANGVSAAMKYMSNPSIMKKITALMGPMMGGKK